ncbi:hypothetical protein [Streptomyces sp. AVP053U2]|uniref:hypothetical protein n=1 Tax=Streptomyces sp. AVP053U2 TaxID=1737066 RepID=UPI00073C3A59|nr:hypothetical protein [Streptomyces sp. AVP053U2]ODA75559.1 hypothetical protein APS67_000122 [Streptomyces sp. AVP053U2]
MAKTTAADIRAERDRKLANIRSRRDLTAQARQVSIARAQQDAEAKMQALLQEETERYHRQRGLLERRLFGGDDSTGYNALSARDAREKAAKLTDPREAQEAFQRAQRAGDTDMVKAIASHAADQAHVHLLGQAWQPIVSAYAESSPSKADTYNELANMQQPNSGSDWSFALDTPSELGRLTTQQVLQLAGSDLTVYGSGPEAA